MTKEFDQGYRRGVLESQLIVSRRANFLCEEFRGWQHRWFWRIRRRPREISVAIDVMAKISSEIVELSL